MKTIQYTATVMILLLIIFTPHPITSIGEREGKAVEANVESYIRIMESGLIHRLDNIFFLNYQEPITSNIIFKPPINHISNLFSIDAKVNGKQALCKFMQELGLLNPYFKIEFKENSEEVSKLSISYILINQYSYINQSTLNFSIPMYPIIQIDGEKVKIQSFNMIINIPHNLTLDVASVHAPSAKWTFKEHENTLYINSTNITINDKVMMFFNLIGKTKQIICPYLEETLEINSAKVKILTRISIQNRGDDEIEEIQIEIPKNAEDIRVFDIMGDIKLDINSGRVYLRYPLLRNYNYTFIASCTLPVIDFKNNSEIRISTPHFVSYPVMNADVTLILPSYANTKPKDPLPIVMQSFPESVMFKYKLINVTTYNSKILTISYNEPTMHVNIVNLLKWLSILLMVSLTITLYLLSKKRSYTCLKLVPEHISIVEKLCLKYEEKASLIDELRNLGDRLIDGSIKKRLYEQRVDAIRNDLIKLDMEIKELKSEIKTRYIREINEIETELSNLLHILESIENYRKQFLLKKIKRGVYDELTISSKKQFKRLYAKVLSLVKSLREEIEKSKY
jgi:hypothetical protein